MRSTRILPAFLVCAAAASSAAAADLSKIDRHIPVSPAASGAAPGYGLLLFGPEAKTRIWLVVVGDTLYIDRTNRSTFTGAWQPIKAVEGAFNLGDVVEEDGKTRHTDLRVRPGDVRAVVSVSIKGKGRQSAGWDRLGRLVFASRPEEAPIVHFNGPLAIDLFRVQRPLRSASNVRVSVVVGTSGLGNGTFAEFGCDSYLGDARPTAEIDYPNKEASKPPIRALVVLDRD